MNELDGRRLDAWIERDQPDDPSQEVEPWEDDIEVPPECEFCGQVGMHSEQYDWRPQVHRADRPAWHPDDCNGTCCWTAGTWIPCPELDRERRRGLKTLSQCVTYWAEREITVKFEIGADFVMARVPDVGCYCFCYPAVGDELEIFQVL